MGIPLLYATEPVQAGTCRPSELQILVKMNFLESHKAPGSNGPLPYFFTDGGKVPNTVVDKILEINLDTITDS